MAKKNQDWAVTEQISEAVLPVEDSVAGPSPWVEDKTEPKVEDSPASPSVRLSRDSEIKAKYEAIVKQQGKGLDGPQFEAYTAELKADRKAVDAAREASK